MRSLRRLALISYPTIGGSGRIATELAGILAARGLEVHLISYGQPAWLPSGVEFHRVDVMEYPLLKYPPYDQALAAKIVELHEERDVRLFHAHYAVPHAVAVHLADTILGGKRLCVVTTLHGTDITLVGSDRAYRRPVLFGLERSDAVTAVSQSLADDTRRLLGFAGELRVVPNFVDPAVFRPGTEPRWPQRAADSPRRLVHISTFRPVKKIEVLCRAVEILRRRLPIHLTLVGDGPELDPALRWFREHGLMDAVRSVGAVQEPAPYVRDADLYVFSSRIESFGLGVLEAMACGVPVVGPCVGGVPEVLGEPPAGCLVTPGSAEEIAAAAERLLADVGEYEQAAARGRPRALAAFAPDLVVPQYVEVYESALARGGA